MRWTRGNRSNVEDVRGGGGGGGVGIPLGIGGVLVLLVGSWLTGVNLFDVVGGGGRHRCGRRPPGRVVARGRKDGRLRRRGHGRHPEHVVRETGELPADARCTLPRLDPVGVRVVELGDGPVLLPGRPQGLSRPQLFRRSSIRSSARPAISLRPTSSRTKPGITFRT